MKTVWNGNLKWIIFRLKPYPLILWTHGWAVQESSFCRQTQVYFPRMVCMMDTSKRSGCCLHEDLTPMAVQGQPNSPACLIVSLGQEGLVWHGRGVGVFWCDVPGGYLRLMLRLQGNRNLEHERYNRNKPFGLQKEWRCTQPRKPLFLLKKLLQRQQQIEIFSLVDSFNFPDSWLCWVYDWLSEGNHNQ